MNSNHWNSDPRLRALLLMMALVLAPLAGLMPAGVANAASGDCTTATNQTTCTFDYTGAAETWTVPAGVTEATFELVGAPGGTGDDGKSDGVPRNLLVPGGKGARLRATLPLTPGSVITVLVGGPGSLRVGGFNGGGESETPNNSFISGGGGGGASDIRIGGADLDHRVLVAGGGGGGGASTTLFGVPAVGGPGGDADTSGGNGSGNLPGGGGGTSGNLGGQGGAGAAGMLPGHAGGNGSPGLGGNGATASDNGSATPPNGGSGGGGYVGGGGGGSGSFYDDGGSSFGSTGGGGGGGGSNFAAPNATDVTIATDLNGVPKVLITYVGDTTPPTASPSQSPAANANGWYNGDVSVNWNWADNANGSGIDHASCTTSSTSSGEGAQTLSATCSDNAGNTGSASYAVKVDRTAPMVSVSGVTNGASYPLGSMPVAGCSTSDTVSGVASMATLSISGGKADGTGSFTATCSGASDVAGNTGSASVSYTVAYRWSGFFQPIDNLPTVNSAKAGSALPVKFSLGGNYGLNIFAQGYPKVQAVSCGSGAPTDEIEQTVTAGTSGLSYDAASGQYNYTWKTDKAWASSCRQLTIRLVDGTDHVALFQFR